MRNKKTSSGLRRAFLGGLAAAFTIALAGETATAAQLPRVNPPPLIRAAGSCIPVYPDNPLGSDRDPGHGSYTDNNPTLYAAGDATFRNHEGEGLVIVEGDATFDRFETIDWGNYVLGAGAGGGSGSWPAADSLMLTVGGDFVMNGWSSMTLGLNTPSSPNRWGTWHVGGSGDTHMIYQQNKRVQSIDGTAADGYRERLDAFDGLMETAETTGAASIEDENTIALVGDGTASLQKFELDYQTFGQALQQEPLNIKISNVPDGASLVLNVTGDQDIQLTGAIRFTLNGKTVNAPEPPYTSWVHQDLGEWGALTQRMLWRFPDSRNVEIGWTGPGHDQFTGSILASKEGAHLRMHESSNGRVVSFGDLTMFEGDSGGGNLAEFHSFPFLFPGLGCSKTEDGTFALKKALDGLDSNVFPEGTMFTARASWVEANAAGQLEPRSEVLSLPADGTLTYHGNDPELRLPKDTVVTFEELGVALPEGAILPEGYVLDSASFSPRSVVVGAADASVSNVTLTNSYRKVETGTFTVRKALEGAEAGNFPPGTVFQVLAIWQEGGQEVERILEVPVDGTSVSGPELPMGTIVTFDEINTPEPEGYVFSHPEFSASQLTIGENTSTEVTVTNHYRERVPGTLQVKKELRGIDQAAIEGREFTVLATWQVNGEEDSAWITVPADGQFHDSGVALPVGTEVSFSEPNPPEIVGHDWQSVTFEPETLLIEDEGAIGEVTATNTYEPQASQQGTFAVQKALSGLSSDVFPEDTVFKVTAMWDEGGNTRSEVLEVPVDGGPVEATSMITAGTEVHFSESTPLSPSGFEWVGVEFGPSPVVIGAGETMTVTATNTYRAKEEGPLTGGFSLKKSLAGAAASDFPADTVFEVVAEWSVDGETSTESFQLPVDGQTVEGPQDLPVGTVVTFSEDEVVSPDGFEWEGVSLSPESFTVADGESPVVTVTNTYRETEIIDPDTPQSGDDEPGDTESGDTESGGTVPGGPQSGDTKPGDNKPGGPKGGLASTGFGGGALLALSLGALSVGGVLYGLVRRRES